MAKKIKILFLTILILNFLVFSVSPVLAASWLEGIVPGDELIPTACTKKIAPGETQEGCGLTQIFQTIINFSQVILALTGTAALLMFTYGGVLWILAAGKQEMIQQGKSAIVAAAVGLAIVLGAWTIVHFTIVALTGGDVSRPATTFNQSWFQEQRVSPGTQQPDIPSDLREQLEALPQL